MSEKFDLICLAGITRADELSALTGWIHDCWFSLGGIVFNEDSHQLEIEYKREFLDEGTVVQNGLLKTVEAPVYTCYLIINGVTEYAIDDTESVGEYDFNDIDFDGATKTLKISTGIPLGMFLRIDKIDIRIYRREVAVEKRFHKVLF